MSDVGRLLGWFADGTLVRPDASLPNTVDLSCAMASLCGRDDVSLTRNAHAIADAVGPADHYIFVLVDGLGMNLIEALPEDGFLRRHFDGELRTVFPSSTAPCLTSLATGLWPAAHGVPGWFTYLPTRDVTAVVLPYVARHDKRHLSEHGIDPAEVFPVVAQRAEGRDRAWVVPKDIAGSVYTRYSSADAANTGYDHMTDAVDAIRRRIGDARRPTYTYWYVPFVDVAEHTHGPTHPEVERVLSRVQRRIAELASSIAGAARMIVTADHGQIAIARHVLADDDPLLECLRAPPSCEPRVPAFHLRPGVRERFSAMFRERFGTDWALLTVEEVESLELFGPGALSASTRERLGDFIALTNTSETIWYRPDDVLLGSHGGLHPDEMRVPLIVV